MSAARARPGLGPVVGLCTFLCALTPAGASVTGESMVRDDTTDAESFGIRPGEPFIPAGKIGVGLYGDNGRLAALLDGGRYRTYPLAAVDPGALRVTRVLVIQNLRVAPAAAPPLAGALAAFVMRGGGLVLAGNTCWSIPSPFPDVVRGCIVPPQQVDGRHVRDRLMKVTDGRWIIEQFTGQSFAASNPLHSSFKMGPEGRTIVLDRYDWPVVIGATPGSGRVIYTGCDYTALEPVGKEADVTRALLDYVAGLGGGPLTG